MEPEQYLTPIRDKRRITAKKFDDYQANNIIDNHQNNNSKGYVVPNANTAEYKNSFFVKAPLIWNGLEDNIVSAPSVESFRARLVHQ